MKAHSLKFPVKILMILIVVAFAQNIKANAFSVFTPKASMLVQTDTTKHVAAKARVATTKAQVATTNEKDLDDDAKPGNHNVVNKNMKHPEDGIDNNIIQRNKQEFLRIKDPTMNGVPVERLMRAKAIKDQMVAHPAANVPGVASTAPLSSTLSWTERGPNNVGGRTRALMYDRGDAAHGYKKVFAGGVDGGLWYTTDITASPVTWNRINDFFENIAISCIAQNPVNPQEIYAGTGEGFYNGDAVQGLGVWKSSDGGTTWARLASTSFYTGINAILVDKNGSVYLAAQNYGILKSANGGSTWSGVITTSSGADLQLAANGDVYASTGVFSTGSIYISGFAANGANTGNAGTWTNITPNPSGTITPSSTDWWRIKLAVAPSNANIVYALFQGYNTYDLSSLQQYNKGTNTWAVKTVPPASTFNNGQAWYAIAAAVDPNNANTLFAGSLDGGRSTDGGSTWTIETQWYVGEVSGLNANQYVHADHHAYTFAPGSSTNFLIGCDGGIFYTSTATAANPAFEDRNHGYNVTQFYGVALHPTNNNYALAGAQDNGTQQFTTAGMNATNEVTGGDGAESYIDQSNGNIQVTSYVYNNHWVSTDNGVTFNQVFFGDFGSFINPSDYDKNTKNLYSCDDGGYFLNWPVLTTNANDVPVSGFNGAIITSVNMSPVTQNRVYFGLNNGTVVRVDSANTVTSAVGTVLSPNPSFTNISVSCVAVDPANENHLLVSYFNYGIVSIFETKNALAATPTWTQVEGNLPDMPVRWVMFYPGDPTRSIIATELGVWTTDLLNGASTTWNATNSGLANVEVDQLTYRASDRTLAAATHGRGLFTTTLPAGNALLTNVTLSSGTLTPAFASGTTSYTAMVTNATASITVTPTASDPGSVIKVNGTVVASGTASASIPLAVGNTTIAIAVTAADGVTKKNYSIVVTRPSNNAYLSALTTSSGTLTPAFTQTNGSYTETVSNATTSITVTPTLNNPHATITVNGTAVTSGTASAAVTLPVGNTTISTVVTAQDGVTKKTYSIVVTRVSNNAYLSALSTSVGTLSPAFAMTTGSYTESVSNATASLTVTPTLNNPHGTVTVNGKAVTSGTASTAIPLVVGNTTITTVVTAQDGTTKKTYTIIVNRISNNVYLSSLTLSSGTLSPAFASGTGSYTAGVSSTTATITVTPTTANPYASVTVNGTAVTSGTASAAIPLSFGPNTITTYVLAQDGVTHKTYTVTVTRAASGMNSLYASVGKQQTPMVTSAPGEKVEVNNILSPNGDGINDIWVIKNIAFYPGNTVSVYNKAGEVVFTKKGYANDWDGTSRGSVLNEGTYYYTVDLGNGSTKKGFITVVNH